MSLPILTACSLYESSGRKSLENSAYDIANGTASLVGCEQDAARSGAILRNDDQSEILSNGTWVSVILKQNPSFVCDYQVTSSDAVSPHLEELFTNTLSEQKNH